MFTLLLLAALYFLPTILATHRGAGGAGFFLLNFFFGWTGIGWIAMLLWALASTPRYVMIAPAGYRYQGWNRY